jgi:hypothetical protein
MTDKSKKYELTQKQFKELEGLFDDAEQLAQKCLCASDDILKSAIAGKCLDQAMANEINKSFLVVKRALSLNKRQLLLLIKEITND